MPARKLASKVSAPEPRIARSQKVAADTNVSAASVFGDSEWEMWSAATPPGARHTSWDFSTVPTFPGGFALALAEYAFHRLHKPVASHDRAGAWSTVHNELVCLRTFAEFCVEGGCGSFAEVDAELCDDFLRSLKKARKTDDRIRTILSAIYRLWEYSEALSEPIREIPFGRPLEKLVKKRSGKDGMSENRTPVIPEAIYGPLMATALDYVLNYGATIIAARNELRSAWERESRRLTTRSRTTKYRVLPKLTEEITDRVRPMAI